MPSRKTQEPRHDARRSQSVVVVDDDQELAQAVSTVLAVEGHSIRKATGLDEARAALRADPDIVLLDIVLRYESGLDLLDELPRDRRRPIVIAMTALGTAQAASEAIRRGADDFLEKPFELEDLLERIRDRTHALPPLRSVAPPMRAAIARLLELSQSNLPILLVGEPGTGKEVAARWVHRLGRVQGPFTKAPLDARHRGTLPALGRAGTLYIDDLGALDQGSQEALLRALHASGEDWAGARIVAAMTEAPQAAVAEGRLHAELLRHFAPGEVRIPALRERLADVPFLAAWLSAVEDLPPPSPETARALSERTWPGNIPELARYLREHAT